MIAALVPVKELGRGKSRLRAHLGDAGVEKLSVAMLKDVLQVLKSVEELDPIAVVTPDPRVVVLAQEMGVTGMLRPDPGLNESLSDATQDLAEQGALSVLVVMADAPQISLENIHDMIRMGDEFQGPGVVLLPSADGGTLALLKQPWNVIPFAFGPNSAELHRQAAQERGAECHVYESRSQVTDVDQVQSLSSLLEGQGAQRTQEVLKQLRWKVEG